MNFSRTIAFALAVLILVGSGMMYRAVATDSEQLEAAASRVQDVALEIGEWKAQEVQEKEIDQRAFANAGARGFWLRNYVHQRNKNSLLVILMCGRAGKMAIHTPDVCYQGAGFEMIEQPVVYSIKNELTEELGRFWTGQFSLKSKSTTNLRLYWAWNSRGQWEASANPRWQYRGEPFLYKLYLSRDLGARASATAASDPAVEFLRLLLPELNRVLAMVDMQK